MKRDKHSLSHYKLLTGEMGRLIPVAAYEVLPGDTFQQQTSMLVRCSPLIAPVMHPVTVRVHHWFVPFRLLWDGWEKFITGGNDGLGDGVGLPPQIAAGGGTVTKGCFGDYIGIPPGTTSAAGILAWPWLAYKKIWEDWYVDQDFYDPDTLPTPTLDWGLLPVCWEKDYFTTSRPWPQKGPDVVVPLAGTAPVVKRDAYASPLFLTPTNQNLALQANQDSNANWNLANGATGVPVGWQDPNLQADLSQATGANINDFRRAFAIQRYQEARARYGSRYTEYLAYLGVRSSDARLQRSEFLGGGKQTISFSEVLQTAPGSTDGSPGGAGTGVGAFAGHGISAMRSGRYRRFFEEHGIVLSLMSVRPKTMYTQGVPRWLTRTDKESYWQRELEQIGQQEVLSKEVHYQAGDTVWGYQDRYSEYKSIPSGIAGDFRDTLDFYHLAREFSAPPALNGTFIVCQPSKRIFQEQSTDSLWIMAYNSIQARRMVRRSGSSRII